MKKIILMIAVSLMSIGGIKAQEFSFGADIVSSFLWRGQHLSSSSIQPWGMVEKSGFSFQAWANYEITKELTDFDLILEYKNSGFLIGLQDYYFPLNKEKGYFGDWTSKSGSHNLEAHLGYNFGKIGLDWYTVVLGQDHLETGTRCWSSYFDIYIPFKMSETMTGKFSVGATPWDDHFTNSEGHERFSVVDIDLRIDKKLTDKISVFGQVMYNPQQDNIYFSIGLSL